jgi:hypothetical protein
MKKTVDLAPSLVLNDAPDTDHLKSVDLSCHTYRLAGYHEEGLDLVEVVVRYDMSVVVRSHCLAAVEVENHTVRSMVRSGMHLFDPCSPSSAHIQIHRHAGDEHLAGVPVATENGVVMAEVEVECLGMEHSRRCLDSVGELGARMCEYLSMSADE